MIRALPQRLDSLAPVLLCATLLACSGGDGGAADSGPDVPVVIVPDFGGKDPGNEAVTPADAADETGDPGSLDTAVPDPGPRDPGNPDPGVEDPGVEDPGAEDPGATADACTGTCGGKECGKICGVLCGLCTELHGAGWQCSYAPDYTCICTPQCSGRTCGDDGCGGSCGTCTGGAECDTTSGTCMTRGPCQDVKGITCQDLSKTVNTNNGGISLDLWPAACGGMKTLYPERVFRFVADQSGEVTIAFSDPPDGLDLYLLEGTACNTDACTQRSHDSITFQAVSGSTYHFVKIGRAHV